MLLQVKYNLFMLCISLYLYLSTEGDAMTRKTSEADENHDGSSDSVAISKSSTVCVGMVNFQGNFTTKLYKWYVL